MSKSFLVRFYKSYDSSKKQILEKSFTSAIQRDSFLEGSKEMFRILANLYDIDNLKGKIKISYSTVEIEVKECETSSCSFLF